MKTYLDSESAKTVLTAVKTYTNNKVDSIPEATTTSAGLLSPADKQKLQDTRFLGTFTILADSWDPDRLFLADVVLTAVAIAEILNFPSIPVNVSMNEYVEISKYYGTPKSRAFVNGILDRIVKQLQADGAVRKIV